MNRIKAVVTKQIPGLWDSKKYFIPAVCFILTGGIFTGWTLDIARAVENAELGNTQAFVANSTPIAIAFMLSILILKITACVLGYLIVRLGHDTLVKGISGEIDFGFSGSGFQTKLKAGSPGALFVLMGAAIIIWGLAVQKPMEIKILPSNHKAATEKLIDGSDSLHRTPVPD